MADQEQVRQSKNTVNAKSSYLLRLKEYKEFIAIILFFMGGVIWITGFFATRNQVEIMECLLHNKISLVESKVTMLILPTELARMKSELESLEKLSNDLHLKERIHYLKTNIEFTSKALGYYGEIAQKCEYIMSTNQCQSF